MRTPAESDEAECWGGRRAVFTSDDQRVWLERMAAKGWTAPAWPREYGGAGLDPAEVRVLEEELRAIGARAPLKSLGMWMLAPILFEHGTEDQRREHLPPIARGEIRWCQGYSEPGAGSDLASLATRAVRDGDTFVVDGQKIWTSHADRADWMFCLVRTDPEAPKHKGISFLLIDMGSAGVRVRPILLISGASPFCETFFTEVRVPAKNLVGQPGAGWTIAKALLAHERAAISRLRDAAVLEEEPLEALARRCVGVDDEGRIIDPVMRDRIAQANLDALCNRLTLHRSAEAVRAGREPGPETSMAKLYGTELNKRRKELRVAIQGFRGLGWEGDAFTPDERKSVRDWLRSRASSIEGGTSEIQLNIIAKRVLGLPD
jgi:alkylation response protein AidB-like acyl-CoA dehydrogenase